MYPPLTKNQKSPQNRQKSVPPPKINGGTGGTKKTLISRNPPIHPNPQKTGYIRANLPKSALVQRARRGTVLTWFSPRKACVFGAICGCWVAPRCLRKCRVDTVMLSGRRCIHGVHQCMVCIHPISLSSFLFKELRG